MRMIMQRHARNSIRQNARAASSARVITAGRAWATATSSRSAATAVTEQEQKKKWQPALYALTDEECPLCRRETGFIAERDARLHGEDGRRIQIVDISQPGAAEQFGLSQRQAMESIHAVDADGTVHEGIGALKRMYEEVNLGWVYAAARWRPTRTVLDKVYSFWARYRLPITGRASSVDEVISAAERVEESNGASCQIDGSGCQ